ncbi:MAG: hypothetical protein IJV86_01130, partial [Clostridia bacterium]|nr:hypothetical protein [Clostridia bacterium]
MAGVVRLEWLRPLVLSGFYLRQKIALIQAEHCASVSSLHLPPAAVASSPVHAEKPRAWSSSLVNNTQKNTDTANAVSVFLAGVVRLELTARGFGGHVKYKRPFKL